MSSSEHRTDNLVMQQLYPQFVQVGEVNPGRTIPELAAEPSLFSCSLEQANALGGEITQEVLAAVLRSCPIQMKLAYEAGLHEVIDVRVQRLMPGMFPSIPGWHCDFVPRSNYFAQPDFALLNSRSFHVTCLVDTDDTGIGLANTVFLKDDIEFRFDAKSPVWRQLHQQIESGPHRIQYVKPGCVIRFDSRTPHKAAACVRRGWRYFFRMSMHHNPPIVNKVSSCQQVYVLSEENGW